MKNILIAILGLVILFYSGCMYVKNQKLERQLAEKEVAVRKAGEDYTQAKNTFETSIRAARDLYDAELARLKEELDKKPAKIRQIITVPTVIRDTLQMIQFQHDTIINEVVKTVENTLTNWEYQDQWVDFSLTQEVFWSVLTYEVRDTIHFDVYEERQGLFKPRKIVTRGTNSNPNSQVEGLSSVVFTDRKKPFGISIFAGVDYQLRPTIGLGLTYTPIRF